MKIYCAGPLFNDKEKEEMLDIATVLENSGYDVFLPHRDGFEYADLINVLKDMKLSDKKANELLNNVIFDLDAYQVIDSDGLVFNMNGRVPDEGACVEVGLAWSFGKPIVLYKNDARTSFNNTDNPMITGLANFSIINDIPDIPKEFQNLFSSNVVNEKPRLNQLQQVMFVRGRVLSEFTKYLSKTDLCEQLISMYSMK